MSIRFQLGVSMIEVLVTMVIVAIGALGLAGMQLNAAKYNKEASVRSAATLLTVELVDRMRANMAGLKAGNYTRNYGYATALANPVSSPSCGTTIDCTAVSIAQLDLSNWLNAISAALPEGTGAVVPINGTGSAFNIVVMWKEKTLVDENATDPNCVISPVVGVRCFQTTFMP